MSSVISNKQEKEKKAAAAEERRKRERRRMKELGGVNGADTPEDEEDAPEEKTQGLPLRGHATKGGRSLSPAVGRGLENGHSNISSTMNGGHSASFGGQPAGGTRDSFLNYFFGKEGGLPAAVGPAAVGGTAAAAAMGNRHVSHNAEPSFAQSIRRGENRPVSQHTQDDYDISRTSRDYDYTSPFVSHPTSFSNERSLCSSD